MAITLHFGLHFDPKGRLGPWPSLPGMPAAEVFSGHGAFEWGDEGVTSNELSVGPLGLLGYLEQHTGLSRPTPSAVRQRLAYEQALKDALSSASEDITRKGAGPHGTSSTRPFYARSFEADPEGVTTTLLSWREELLFAGWNPVSDAGVPARLRDLARVELCYRAQWRDLGMGPEPQHPGYADRIIHCLQRWEKDRCPATAVLVYDAVLPSPWERLFDRLVSVGFRIRRVPRHIEPSGETDLGRWQRFLRGEIRQGDTPVQTNKPEQSETKGKGAATKKDTPQLTLFQFGAPEKKVAKVKDRTTPVHATRLLRDGSVVILKAFSEQSASEGLAVVLSGQDRERSLPLILHQSDSIDLDLAFEKRGLPCLGITRRSRSREASQLLLLSTAFLWDPLDPRQIIDWLSLAHKPIPRSLAKKLASSLSDYPGVFSDEWEDQIKKYQDSGFDPGVYKSWFLDLKRNRIEDGAARGDVVLIFKKLKKWADKRAFLADKKGTAAESRINIAEQHLSCKAGQELPVSWWHELAAMAGEMAEAVETSTVAVWQKVELERFLISSLAGDTLKVSEPQQHAPDTIRHPGALRGITDSLVWWDFRDMSVPYRSPWSMHEFSWLQEKGIGVESSAERSSREYRELERAILSVDNQLIMVIPTHSEGSPVREHPLSASLEACFGDLSAITLDLDRALQDVRWVKGWKFPDKTRVKIEGLGAPDPYWRLSAHGGISLRPQESFSSLNKLFNYPYQWILYYAAAIRPTQEPMVELGPRVRGNLAHRVVERLLLPGDVPMHWSTETVQERIRSSIDETISREGALLKLAGQEVELASFRHTTESAVRFLLDILRKKEWEVIGLEKRLEGSLDDIDMMARADLLLKLNNTVAIIDIKYGSLNRRENEIINSSDIQLALYDKLAREEYRDVEVISGYFIIVAPRLLTASPLFGVPVVQVQEVDEFNRERQWKQIRGTVDWRFSQFAEGKVEVRRKSTIDELDPPPPNLDVVELEKENDRYDDYSLLAEPE